MIQLHPDCLVFKISNGESIPCSAEVVTVELMGDSVSLISPAIVREAASAVVYYFKNELGQTSVSIGEFSEALERVLNGLGFSVTTASASATAAPAKPTALDLRELMDLSAPGVELLFYQRLRDEFRAKVKSCDGTLRFEGLRTCVKRLAGRKRWCKSCERASDQIIDYLRECLNAEPEVLSCNLVVQ